MYVLFVLAYLQRTLLNDRSPLSHCGQTTSPLKMLLIPNPLNDFLHLKQTKLTLSPLRFKFSKQWI